MPMRPLALVILAPAAVTLCACSMPANLPVGARTSSSTSPVSPSAVIDLLYDSVEPSRVTIHVGQTVEWKWEEAPTAGNITFAGFASPTMDSGIWSHTFSSAGRYPFRDTLSQLATGVVTVLP